MVEGADTSSAWKTASQQRASGPRSKRIDSSPMLPLDDARWSTLSDAYGGASGIPKLLADAARLPEDNGAQSEPYVSLWSALCHQGDVYSASYAALPHLVRVIEENPRKFRWTLLLLIHAIEVARAEGRGPPIPDDLREPYHKALARVPAVVGALLTGKLTELELQVAFAACASAKGFPSIGEAISELTPEMTRRFLEEWRYQ